MILSGFRRENLENNYISVSILCDTELISLYRYLFSFYMARAGP